MNQLCVNKAGDYATKTRPWQHTHTVFQVYVCLECITILNQAVHRQAMAVQDIKRQAELPKAVAMHNATLATAYLQLKATLTIHFQSTK